MGPNSVPTDHRSPDAPIDAEFVVRRLEQANITQHALPVRIGPPKLSAQTYGYDRDASETGERRIRHKPSALKNLSDVTRLHIDN
jgi:hypothetical protein